MILPFEERWKDVFSSTPQKLFSDLEENLSFSYDLQLSSFEQGYDLFASGSVIASGSERTKESFRALFIQVMEKHFWNKGIDLVHIPFKVFMYWCTKEI